MAPRGFGCPASTTGWMAWRKRTGISSSRRAWMRSASTRTCARPSSQTPSPPSGTSARPATGWLPRFPYGGGRLEPGGTPKLPKGTAPLRCGRGSKRTTAKSSRGSGWPRRWTRAHRTGRDTPPRPATRCTRTGSAEGCPGRLRRPLGMAARRKRVAAAKPQRTAAVAVSACSMRMWSTTTHPGARRSAPLPRQCSPNHHQELRLRTRKREAGGGPRTTVMASP
mmetsp:Transcript_56326/g.178295  ORF Transcript_56326/g.178295 Transcript_56326/m.178295 type:complete len:224 (+) Transcript_56326:153-824(+)